MANLGRVDLLLKESWPERVPCVRTLYYFDEMSVTPILKHKYLLNDVRTENAQTNKSTTSNEYIKARNYKRVHLPRHNEVINELNEQDECKNFVFSFVSSLNAAASLVNMRANDLCKKLAISCVCVCVAAG